MHLRGAHGGGAHAMGLLIDLDRHLDALGVGADPHDGLQASRRIASRSSGCGCGMMRSTTSRTRASATPIEEMTSASLRDLAAQADALGNVGDEGRRAAALADQQALVGVELVFLDEALARPE